MELSQLRYFKALAENGNLTKTAAQLYISAPSLSLSISKLEQELGTSLFDRVRGRMFLNDRGKLLLDAISSGLTTIDSATSSVRALGATHDNRLTIATTNQVLFNGLLADFIALHPEIHLTHRHLGYFKSGDDSLLVKYDFLLTRKNSMRDASHLTQETLYSDNELMVSVPRNHPLSTRTSVRLEELAEERFIFPAQSPPETQSTPFGGLNGYYLQLCRDAGFEPNVVADCSYLTMLSLQRRGLGICFTSRRGYPLDAFTNDCVPVRLEGVVSDEFLAQSIYYDRRRKLSRAAQLFLEFALHYFDE